MKINNKQSLLSKIVTGYEDIEPCIIVALALRHNVFLEARHGVGKTTLGTVLGAAADTSGRGFRYYPCDKAGLIDLGGLPDMEKSSKSGMLSYVPTNRSIFGAKVILADELPRASKDRMNYWLEILEQRSFQGQPVNYDLCIATGNPATYKGNNKLDLALKNRFLFWLPCRDFSNVTSNEVMDMIKLNVEGRTDIATVAKELSVTIEAIRKKVSEYMANPETINQLSQFIGTFTQFVKDKISVDQELSTCEDSFISPREFAYQMIHAMMGLGAYFHHMGYKNALQLAGEYTIKYTIETRHASSGPSFLNICAAAWRQLRGMLVDDVNTPEGRLKWAFASAISAPQKIAFWRENIADVCSTLGDVDITVLAGDTLQQVTSESVPQIGPFWQIMKSAAKTRHVAEEVEGFMLTEVARRLKLGGSDSSSVLTPLYNKYKDIVALTPENVSEILSSKES